MSLTQPLNDAMNPAPGYKPDNTYTPQDDSVAKRLNGLLDTTSPLMQQASTQAAQAANKRGLQNSSMAVEAGQKAVIDSALPIAAQDASQTFQKNLSAQGTAQSKELQAQAITGQQALQAASIDAQAKLQYNQIEATKQLSQAQIESTEKLAGNAIAAQEQMLGRQLSSAETQQIRQIAATKTLQEASITSQEGMQQTGIAAQKELLGMQLSANKDIAQLQTDSAQTIAKLNISAADRQNATNANIAIQNTYATMFDAIANNPNIPPDVRQQYLDAIKGQAENSATLIQSIYSSNVNWPSGGGAAKAPAPEKATG